MSPVGKSDSLERALSTPPVTQGSPALGTGVATNCDVLFSPNGPVIGQGASAGMIYLWVRRAATDGTNAPSNASAAATTPTWRATRCGRCWRCTSAGWDRAYAGKLDGGGV